jgi:hypothetical protein
VIWITPVDANDQLIEADLEGDTYYIGLSWNQTMGAWTMSVRDLAGEYLASALPLVPYWPLLHQVRKATMPPGEIGVWTRDGLPPGRQDFNDMTAVLVYFTAAEMAGEA